MAAITGTIIGLGLAAGASVYSANQQRQGQREAVAQAERQAAEQQRQYEETARKAREQAAETAKQASIQLATEQKKAAQAEQIRLQTEADAARQQTLADEAGLAAETGTSARKRRAAYQGALSSTSVGGTEAGTASATGSIRV